MESNKEVFSPDGIYAGNKRYTDNYFEGRIHAKHKKEAEIEITFRIEKKYYKIIRGFFEKDALRYLEIYKNEKNKKIPLISTESLSPKELKKKYEEEMAKDIGINNFEYYTFLQLYVLTFDENRRMLFWDDRASYHTLSIAFNTNVEDTKKLIALKRDIEKYDSDGRNSRWQATQIHKKINDLLKTKNETDNPEHAMNEYKEILKEYDKIEKELNNTRIEYDTLLKNQSFINLEIYNLRSEYNKLYSRYSEPRSKLTKNNYIKMFLDKKECLICGAKGEHVIEMINKSLYKEDCPLCSTRIREDDKAEKDKLFEKITDYDQKIDIRNRELEHIILELSDKKLQLEKIEYEYDQIRKRRSVFEDNNPNVINLTGNQSIDLIIKKYKEQWNELDKESKENYKKRDKLKVECAKLQEKIETAYKDAEVEFVPIFQKLAKSFIGYDININFSKKNAEMKLVMELDKSARTKSHQLSESQRFFLDIALRMALAIYLSKKNEEATMLIDTPEGSLDIAYESRVGEMFADFIKDYNQNILMTANINASQLLISLAEKCTAKKMQFRRMPDWTDLSTVQQQGEKLFEKVYKRIEKALKQE